MVQNPQWPLIDEAISFDSGPNSVPPIRHWVSIIERTEGQTTTGRGRQYELDQVQTGESTVVLRNTDGAFDPDNLTSPYYPQILPYRAHRRRAQYPATVNLLTADQATAGTVSGLGSGSSLPAGVVAASIFPVNIVAGTPNMYAVVLPTTPAFPTALIQVSGWTVAPGVPFTVQAKVTATVATSLRMQLIFTDASGNTLSAPSGTPATVTTAQVISVTATPPANAAGASFNLVLNSAPGAVCTVTATSLQVERSAAPSAYVQPGTWYPLITDYVLEWPQTWQDNGNYGVSSLRCVDAFGYLSQRDLQSPAYMELLALGPSFFYPLDEPTDAALFYDMTANRPPMGVTVFRGAPLTNFTAGNALDNTAAATAAGFLPLGIGGPVATFANPDVASVYGPIAALNLGATGQIGPSPASAWTRIFAVRVPVVPTPSAEYIWTVISTRTNSDILLGLTGNTGQPFAQIVKNGVDVLGGPQLFGNPVTDGGWHLLALTISADGKTLQCFMDNLGIATRTTASDMRPTLTGGIELLGGGYDSTDTFGGYAGDMAFVAELPFAMNSTQQSRLFSTFKFGGSGYGTDGTQPPSSGKRYQDILRWAGWVGPQAEDTWTTGETNAYGPAVDLLAAAADQGTDTVTAGQNVVTTDNGNHFVAKDGTVTFKARRARYNQTIPAATFGENTAGGEIPYTVAGFGYDVTRLANDVAVNQTSTGNVIRAYDPTSVATYGDVPLQRDVNTLDPNELSDAANFLVDRYRVVKQRLQAISIDLGAQPAAWAAVLALELGSLVKVMRRPPNAPALSFLGFVERISWNLTDQLGATCTLEISNATGLQYEVAGSTRMTLKNLVLASAVSMTCNPLADAATNPIQANISASDGFATWVIDWGTANAEYVQINAVTPNAPGYSSAVFGIGLCTDVATGTTGTGFRHAHSAAAVLQDIGGAALIYTLAQLSPLLTPTNQLDGFATLGVSTILGY